MSADKKNVHSEILEAIEQAPVRPAKPRRADTKVAKERLVKAVLKKNLQALSSSLEDGVDPNFVASFGDHGTISPLCSSIVSGWTEGMSLLLEHGASDSLIPEDSNPGTFSTLAALRSALPVDTFLSFWDNETGRPREAAKRAIYSVANQNTFELVSSGRVSDRETLMSCAEHWFDFRGVVDNSRFLDLFIAKHPEILAEISDDLWEAAISSDSVETMKKLAKADITPSEWAFEMSSFDFECGPPEHMAKNTDVNANSWNNKGQPPLFKMQTDYGKPAGKAPAVIFALVKGAPKCARVLHRSPTLAQAASSWDKAPSVLSCLHGIDRIVTALSLGFDLSHTDPCGRNIAHRIADSVNWNGTGADTVMRAVVEKHPELFYAKDVNGLAPMDGKRISEETRAKLENFVMTSMTAKKKEKGRPSPAAGGASI